VLDDAGLQQFSISPSTFPDVSEEPLARLFFDLPASLDSLRAAYLALRIATSDTGNTNDIEIKCVLG
jgi:hypothetical protein